MKIKSIELVCENCDVFKFDYHEFVQLYVDDIKYEICDGEERYSCNLMIVVLTNDKNREKDIQMINDMNNLTHIELHYEDESKKYICLPWDFTASQWINYKMKTCFSKSGYFLICINNEGKIDESIIQNDRRIVFDFERKNKKLLTNKQKEKR